MERLFRLTMSQDSKCPKTDNCEIYSLNKASQTKDHINKHAQIRTESKYGEPHVARVFNMPVLNKSGISSE